MSTRHFVTTEPTSTTCPRCERLVLDGIEEGFPYRVDPAPLNLTGELTARLAGHSTYQLLAGQIVSRTIETITAEKPNARPPVFAQHSCKPIDVHAISIPQIAETQRLIASKTVRRLTVAEDAHQQCLIAMADVLGGRVIALPDDQDPPF